MSKQITSTVMMIRPVAFRFNEETAVNNYYQKVLDGVSASQVQNRALEEFDAFVAVLRSKAIDVVVIEDTIEPSTPDSIFPNNWISFHQDGRVGLYPMCAENRRLERREDVLTQLQQEHGFLVGDVVDFSHYEQQQLFLEGTGSMLLDRVNHIAYAALSLRTDVKVLEDFCSHFNYQAVTFTSNQSVGSERLPIYHTNVMMCLADEFVVLCADTIDDEIERNVLIIQLEATGKEIIYITEAQKHRFAGNMLQLSSKTGVKYLVMSSSAHKALNTSQIDQIEKHCQILSSSLDTIEACGGGPEYCYLKIGGNGNVEVKIGTQSNGQGHFTSYSQIVSEVLDIDIDQINIIQGNSIEIPKGSGTGGSRSMPVGGNALFLASKTFLKNTQELLAKHLKLILRILFMIKDFSNLTIKIILFLI